MSCSFKCHCGEDLVDDESTRKGYCYECNGRRGQCTSQNCREVPQLKPQQVMKPTLEALLEEFKKRGIEEHLEECPAYHGVSHGYSLGRGHDALAEIVKIAMEVLDSNIRKLSQGEFWSPAECEQELRKARKAIERALTAGAKGEGKV